MGSSIEGGEGARDRGERKRERGVRICLAESLTPGDKGSFSIFLSFLA